MNTLYTQQIESAMGGAHGATPQAIAAAQARIPSILAALGSDHTFMTLAATRADLPEIERLAEQIRKQFSHVIVLGTGGSSLGAMTLTALTQSRFAPSGMNIHYVDNTDPDTLDQLFSQLPLSDTFFLAVSKSGSTVETVAQLLLAIKHLEQGGFAVKEHCLAITVPAASPLRKMAEHYHLPTLIHDAELGGRFSVLSVVGLLPAALAGLSLHALRDGATAVMTDIADHGANSAPALGAALQFALLETGKTMSILMPYSDRLENVGRWYQQLWAESVGKQGKGSSPIRALGAVDQHSQLQLYLGGPRDKFITLLGITPQGKGEVIDAALAQQFGLDYIAGQPLGTILAAQQAGTALTFTRNEVPLRQIILPSITEESIGALLQHYMMETVIMAGLLGVNAFDQPAVEESKTLAREWLATHA
jgi:glucose-6-phosphate isomerase